jgi:serine protease Do
MGMHFRSIMNWPRGRKIAVTVLMTLTLAVGIVIGSVVSDRVTATSQGDANAQLLAVPSPAQLSSTFAAIAKAVEPAIVNISTMQLVERPRSRRGVPNRRAPNEFEFPLDRFFGPFEDGPTAERSLGSGVIVDKSGYILTNNHVVEQATKIEVRLDDGGRYPAKVIGSDVETDLAVIKIEAGKDLPVAKLGNSDGVQVGDWVLAFGSPFGLQATVTAGIVSAKDRANLPGSEQFQRFIQTDAAINPGNSGGPLVNIGGEVIGINTAIVTSNRGYDGVGFALPSTEAIKVYNDLVRTGRVTRGSIGVSFNEERSNNAIVLKSLGAEHGIILESVEPGSPAATAGLRAGDVITSVNGQAVKAGVDLVNPIANTPIGNKVKVGYLRDKVKKEVEVAVADRSKIFPRDEARANEEPEESGAAELGLRVEELTPTTARQLNMEGRSGVVVTQVDQGSFAEDAGFGRGDLIAEVNGQAVGSVAQFTQAVSNLKQGQNVVFKVHRNGGQRGTLTLFLAGVYQK